MSHYLGDRKLLPRVRQYLDEHKQQRSTSIEAMVEDLQARYSDYGRKKKRAFMKSVEKAYSIVQKENHYQDRAAELENQHLLKRRKKDFSSESEGEEKSFSDSAEYVTYEDTNAMNSMMTSLYQRNPSVKKVASQSPVSSTPASPQHVSSMDIAEARNANTQGFVIDRKGFKPASAIPCDTDKLMKHPKPAGRDKQSMDSSESKSDKTVPQCQVTSRAAVTKSAMEMSTSVVDSQGLRGVKGTESPVPTKQGGAETPAPTKLKRVKKSDRLKDSDEKKKTPEVQQSTTKFSDVGGNEDTLKEVCKLLVHMRHPEVYEQLGITPPRGFLLHGPPGCGKTLLANAIAGELELPFLKIAATEIVSGVSGESEEKLRDVFSKALASAPCILFIDEIDAITQKRETASKDMERRIVSQLLTCMDDLNIKGSGHILVIGATNRPDSLDPALRRAGRFDREIALGIPDENARMRILQVLCRDLKLSLGFDFLHLARHTPGYVGADLMALGREAAMIAVNRAFKEIQQAAHQNNQKPQEAATENRQSVTENKHAVTENRQAVTENRPAGKEVRQTTAEVSQTMAEVTQAEIEVSQADTGVNQSASQSSPMAIIVSHAATDTCHTEVSQSEQMETNQASLPREEDGPSKDKVEQVVSSSVFARGTMIIPSANHTDTDSLASVMCWLKEQPPLSENQLQDLFITMDDFQEALQVVQPSAKREGFATVPDVTWDDIGALRDIREELQMAILAPVRHPEHFKSLGLTTPPGILLTGPPGCGKTLLAKAVANESGINFISVKGPELLNMYVGESERAVRQVFQRARNSAPCVIFFDELDALCPRRSDSGEGGSSVRVVNQLLTEMDGLQERKQVFIMGATNRPDIIDPAVLRPGRLDKTLYVGLPSVKDREDILKTITKNGTKPKLAEDVSLQVIAEDSHCERFTGADLAALVREAAVTALREFMSGSQSGCFTNITINSQHFKTAFKKVLPSVSVKDQNLYNKMKDRLYDR